MDFFAGSGSFGAASYIFSINNDVKIKNILVQLPESLIRMEKLASGLSKKVCQNAIKYLEDLNKQPKLSNITIERLMLSANFLKKQYGDVEKDLGFKVLKLDQSNFKQWQAPDRNSSDDELIQQMELHIDHVEDAADPEAILYELLIKAGFMPTEKVEMLILNGKNVYSIADGALLVYLESHIDSDLIQAVADAEPAQFICLDKAFGGNDQLKANAVQTFKALNQSREMKIEFRTV
jgi:adenine-specific DNA-methyltransferase